jgi:hypothetical protein
MQANCSNPALASVASPAADEQHPVAHFLYQSATVLAILLLLMSFWSC